MSVRKRTWKTAAGEERHAWIVDYADQAGKRRMKTFRLKKEADAFETRSSAVMLNVVAQQSGFLVAIWSKLPLPFPVHLCSFFAGHL